MRLYRILLGGVAAAALAASAQAATLYSNDFDSAETFGAGVSGSFSNLTDFGATTGSWNAAGWANNFGRNNTVSPIVTSTLSLTGLEAHTQVTMSFILGFLDSWDGIASDQLEIYIDGAATPVSVMSANNAAGTKDYDGQTALVEYQQVDNNFFFSDTLLSYGLTFAHTGSTLTVAIRAAGNNWQGGTDEAWGIDNVLLTYEPTVVGPGVPEPATWALMIGGFGLAGATLRRRRAIAV